MAPGLPNLAGAAVKAALAASGLPEAPERLQGIQDAMRRPAGPHLAIFAAGLVALVLLVVLGHALAATMRRRRRLVADWAEFGKRLQRWGLSPEHRRLLRDMALRYAARDPLGLVQNIEVFERAVHSFLQPLCAAGPSEQCAQAGADVHTLRVKLGLNSPAGPIYYSSRELDEGQAVQIVERGGGGRQKLNAQVTERREDFLALKASDPVPAGLAGRPVDVMLFQQGRGYRFGAEVVQVDAGRGTCLLTHSLEVAASDARTARRVEVGKPVRFRAAWEGEGVQREGVLVNLSTSGMAVQSAPYYEGQEELVVTLRPSDYVPGVGDQALLLHGSVVQAERQGAERCVYRLQFRDVPGAAAEQLHRLMQRLEQAAGQ